MCMMFIIVETQHETSIKYNRRYYVINIYQYAISCYFILYYIISHYITSLPGAIIRGVAPTTSSPSKPSCARASAMGPVGQNTRTAARVRAHAPLRAAPLERLPSASRSAPCSLSCPPPVGKNDVGSGNLDPEYGGCWIMKHALNAYNGVS